MALSGGEDRQGISREHLRVVYVPIACAAPLLYASASGIFERKGVSVQLHKAPSWDGVRRLIAFGKVDAAHMLGPLAIATALGVEGRAVPVRVAAILNQHGSALLIAPGRGRFEGPRSLRGLTIAVPHRFSIQYYLLCDWLARAEVDPLREVTIIEVPPPRMPWWLAKGKIQAAMAPEPYAQMLVDRGIGEYVLPSHEVWLGHPCCSFAFAPSLWQDRPRVAEAALSALIEAEAELVRMNREDKRAVVKQIGGYLPGSAGEALGRVLAGDPVSKGLPDCPDRITFAPTPHLEYAIWILAQMQRWGHLAGPVDHRQLALRIFDPGPAAALSSQSGVFPERPSLAALAPFSFDDPCGSVNRSLFGALRDAPLEQRESGLSDPARRRMTQILERLAEVAGGFGDFSLDATFDDELGELERAIDEALRARAFVEEAAVEQIEIEDQASKQTAVIDAQRALIRQLGVPIVPVLSGLLLVPLMGQIDDARAADIEERVLSAAFSRSARTVLIDVTGVPTLEASAISLIQRLSRALALIGSSSMLVGISPAAARALAASADVGDLPRCERDLSSAISVTLRDSKSFFPALREAGRNEDIDETKTLTKRRH